MPELKFGSLFAGIGGFDLGFERAGLRSIWQSEIDPSCLKVLGHHWPEVHKHGDIEKLGGGELEPVDLVAGGFPCQDISVAGRRAGLGGKRSGLWFEFHRILAEHRPAWVVIENVPGLFSSQAGRDLAVILRGLVELGYSPAWRVLDVQHFRIPQRRRRVYIVGHLGDYRAAEVLLESESLRGDLAAGEETRERIAEGTLSRALSRVGGGDDPGANKGATLIFDARGNGDGDLASTLPGDHMNRVSDYTPVVVAAPLRSRSHPNSNAPGRGGEDDENLILAMSENQRSEVLLGEISRQLTTGGGKAGQGYPAALTLSGVRRLTPTECERLQGFPDGWTAGHSDTVRYRMLGNAVCVAVAEWLGRRILTYA